MAGTPDLIIRGGMVVTGGAVVEADVVVQDGVIAGVGRPGTAPAAREVVDASGKHVIPGAIDAHFHFKTFSLHDDTLESAIRSAAHGGITTVVGFIRGREGMTARQTVDHFKAEGEKAVVDFAFHLNLGPHDDFAAHIADGLERGITSFKMFMAYARRGFMLDDGLLYRAMRGVAAAGGLAMVHAENGSIIDRLEDEFAEAGRRSPVDFSHTRPAFAEVEAIRRAIQLAEAAGCPLYVVHVSTAGGCAAVAEARARGLPITGETCPQYLTLDDGAMARFGSLAKIAPPLRAVADRHALWQGLTRGDLSTVGSDHSPYRRTAKEASADIFEVPFGAPGTETLLPVLYSEGVLRRGLSPAWLARVISENPARVFGLYPRKGIIAPGADADLVILDPSVRWTVRAADLHSVSDYTLFEGMALLGRPVDSWVRGQRVLRGGEFIAEPGQGRYVACAAPGAPAPA
ncbi:MAG: dihydropyrimidinase [Armatimonadetes bacterium]|nr:dihydropyrimidinase [Armatimonadota bacterium]